MQLINIVANQGDNSWTFHIKAKESELSKLKLKRRINFLNYKIPVAHYINYKKQDDLYHFTLYLYDLLNYGNDANTDWEIFNKLQFNLNLVTNEPSFVLSNKNGLFKAHILTLKEKLLLGLVIFLVNVA